MAKSLDYYKELSKQLEEEIEIYESSYEDFEKAIDLEKVDFSSITDEQKKIIIEFESFVKKEGFSKDGKVRLATYPKIKKAIIDRVKFLKEQKENNDKLLKAFEELDRLGRNGTLTNEEQEHIKNEAKKKEHMGTKEHADELKKQREIYVKNKIEVAKEAIKDAKQKAVELKKENSFGKVVKSAFGPVGDKVYNLYAKAQNINVKLRKRRWINGIGKSVASVAIALGTVTAFAGFPAFVGFTAGVTCLVRTIRNSFKKVPEKLPQRPKKTTLKEAWLRFRKSRKGNKKMTTQQKLYQGVDFSRYAASTLGSSEPSLNPTGPALSPTGPEMNLDNPTPVEPTRDETTVEPARVETPVEPTRVETPVEPTKVETPVEPTRVETPVEPTRTETPVVNSKYNLDDKNRLVLLKNVLKMQKEISSGSKFINSFGARCQSLDDVRKALVKFDNMIDKYENGELVGSDKAETANYITRTLFSLIKARDFALKNGDNNKNAISLYEMCGDKLFNEMPEDLLKVVNENLRYRQVFGNGKEYAKKKNDLDSMYERQREEAYEDLLKFIYDEGNLDRNIMRDVADCRRHYHFTEKQNREISEALSQREEYINSGKGRGK